MSENQEKNRTLLVDKEVLYGLQSEDLTVRKEAIESLPEALTPKELLDLGLQVRNTVYGRIRRREEAERDALFHIGTTALIANQDRVTAENAARELRGRGLYGFIGFLLLKNELRKHGKGAVV